MTTLETPLSQAEIKCENCGQPLETFAQWFSQDCPSDQATGHSLKWEEIILLKFRLEETKA